MINTNINKEYAGYLVKIDLKNYTATLQTSHKEELVDFIFSSECAQALASSFLELLSIGIDEHNNLVKYIK